MALDRPVKLDESDTEIAVGIKFIPSALIYEYWRGFYKSKGSVSNQVGPSNNVPLSVMLHCNDLSTDVLVF